MGDVKFEITDVKFRRASGRLGGYDGKSRVYIFPEGESLLENFFVGRHTRPYEVWKKEVIPQLWSDLGVPEGTKVAWRQRCGCTCRCSPGFIVQGRMLRNASGDPADLYINVKVVKVEKKEEEAA